jgi:anti-sigma B factor antagonist
MQTGKLDLISQPASDAGPKIVRLQGKLALETVHNFVATLRAETAARLVLDMSGVSFLDSAGVGALVQIFVHRRAQGQGFALAALTQQGNAVMTVAGLKKLLPTYDSVDEARRASAASA